MMWLSMALAVSEFQLLLTQLAADLGIKVDRLVRQMDRLDTPEQLAFITDAYPELAGPYLAASGQVSAQWYAEQPVSPAPRGVAAFVAEAAELLPGSRLAASGRWAILQQDPIQSLQGSATRAVFDESRLTIVENADREGVRWARHASANACGFCRMLATRGAVYRGNSKAGFKAHDHCHCLAVPDRDGTYRPAPYAEQWERDYVQARKDGAESPAAIANAMDKAEGGRRSTAGPKVPPPVGSDGSHGIGVTSKTKAPDPASGRGGPPKPPNPPRGTLAASTPGDDNRPLVQADVIVAPAQRHPSSRPAVPPGASELMDRAALTGDPDRFFSRKEKSAADWLRQQGDLTIVSVDVSELERTKTPDSLYRHSDDWRSLEIKTLDQPTGASVTRNLRLARSQSAVVFIDGAQVGLTREAAEAGLREAVRKYGPDFRQIVIRLGDDSAICWLP